MRKNKGEVLKVLLNEKKDQQRNENMIITLSLKYSSSTDAVIVKSYVSIPTQRSG